MSTKAFLSNKKMIRIGLPIPLTGVYGVEANDQLRGASLAVEEFNALGGWDGHHAELVVKDTAFDNDLAASMTQDLIKNDHVNFVVGALKSEDLVTIAHVCQDYNKIFIGICGSDVVLERPHRHPYTFHEGMSFHMIGDGLARFIFSRLGHRVAMLTVDANLGHHFARAHAQVGEQIGVNFAEHLVHKQGEKDLRPYLKKIAALEPEVLVLNNLGQDQANAVVQAHELGLNEKMRIAVTFFSIRQMLQVGQDYYEGLVGSATYYWKLEEHFQSAKHFNNLYRKKYQGSVGGSYAAFGYSAVRSLFEAIRKTQSFETDIVSKGLSDLRMDLCKGPQFFRRLDNQSCQNMVILEALTKSERGHEEDGIFKILEIVHYLQDRSFHVSREVL